MTKIKRDDIDVLIDLAEKLHEEMAEEYQKIKKKNPHYKTIGPEYDAFARRDAAQVAYQSLLTARGLFGYLEALE